MALVYGFILVVGSGLALLVALRLSRSHPHAAAREPSSPLTAPELVDLLRREATQQMNALLGSTLRDLREFETDERRRQAADARETETALIRALEAKIDHDLDSKGFWGRVGFDRNEYLRDLFQQVVQAHDECMKRCLEHLRHGLREFLVDHLEDPGSGGPQGPKGPPGWYDAIINGLVAGAVVAAFPVGHFVYAGFIGGFLARGLADIEELKRGLKEESSRVAHQLMTGDGLPDEKSKERFESVVSKMDAMTKRVCDGVKLRFETEAEAHRVRANGAFDELRELALLGKLTPDALEDPEWVYQFVWEGGRT